MSLSMSTTLLASARSNLMNSLTTSAGGTSTWLMMRARVRITLEFSVTRIAPAFGSARNDVYGCGGEKTLSGAFCESFLSAYRSIKKGHVELIHSLISLSIGKLGET